MKRRFNNLFDENFKSFDDVILDEILDVNRKFINEKYNIYVIKARFVAENLIKK